MARRSLRLPHAQLLGLLLILAPAWASAADPKPGPPLTVRRATGPISLDGDLSDPGWQGADSITTWFETRVGDNVEPQVRNVAFLTYDDKYFYAGFQFQDPHPEEIRAPIGDHDAVSGSSDDYAGVIVDSRNDGKTAQMFLSNPAGVQYDALSSDVSGEDNSPDYFWDSVGKITASGWSLEIRIPFSSLRYNNDEQPTWGMLLYRNFPRDKRYQFFSARLPRDVNCFICNSSKMTGLSHLPHGSHLVVAPYGTAQQTASPRDDVLGAPLDNGDLETDGGVDVKWSPLAGAAVDATWNPDFSQVESDAAQIVANERFALFFPEKRPFFLEGIDLFSTPFQAVYTRTITSPRYGLRGTGRLGSTAFTALVTRDRGGGTVILPGPQGSGDAPQDFRSDVGIVRVRRDFGLSFLSVLGTAREIAGGGHNRVIGPDFQWRPRPTDTFTGQALWSETETPNRPELSDEWDGRTLSDRAFLLNWSHSTPGHDWFIQGQDLGREFRADDGFIPQVGYREGYFEAGKTIRPKDPRTALLSRIRLFTIEYVDALPHTWGVNNQDVLNRRVSVGSGMDGRWSSFFRVELNHDEIRVGDDLLQRFRPRVYLEASPSRFFNFFSIDTYFNDEIDFANGREGTGLTLLGSFALRPTGHLELRCNANRRRLDVDAGSGGSRRLFTAEVERVRATYAFNARSFVRLIGQNVKTRRNPSLYLFEVAPKSVDRSYSGLFAYKLNWQTVLYAGYGDQRAFEESTGDLEKSGRQLFAKVSYAWQQ